MVVWSRVHSALAEDLSSISKPMLGSSQQLLTSAQEGPSSSGLCKHLCSHPHEPYTVSHILVLKIKDKMHL